MQKRQSIVRNTSTRHDKDGIDAVKNHGDTGGKFFFMKKKTTTVTFKGTKEQKAKLMAVIEKYKGKEGNMLPVLQGAQEIYGYLPVEVQEIIAEGLGVPESVIALTFVALGTSLPELVTAIMALAKGHSALSLGNIVGANLFNLALVSGLSIMIAPFNIHKLGEKTIGSIPVSMAVEIPVMLFVMLFMTLPALKGGKLTRLQGIILLCVYAVFCVFQFVY